MNLLLVDDDVKLCRLVREYLEPMGDQVTATHTGPDGLQAALTGTDAGPFDAVILDVDVARTRRLRSPQTPAPEVAGASP